MNHILPGIIKINNIIKKTNKEQKIHIQKIFIVEIFMIIMCNIGKCPIIRKSCTRRFFIIIFTDQIQKLNFC